MVRRPPRKREGHAPPPPLLPSTSHPFLLPSWSRTGDFNMGTLVAFQQGACRDRVVDATRRSGVSTLVLAKIASWIYSFYLSMTVCAVAEADSSQGNSKMLLKLFLDRLLDST